MSLPDTAPQAPSQTPNPPVVILARPQMGENIGAAARAMKNFGLSDLRLVAPRDGWPNEKALTMAAGASDILDHARVFPTLPEALADLHLVLATTARLRGVPKEILTPAEAARDLHQACSTGSRTGLLFGSERAGLDNEEAAQATALITIPTAEFASLNLGQAVLLMGYEWFRAQHTGPARNIERGPLARPATQDEWHHLFVHLESELLQSGFLFPPDKAGSMMRTIRAMLMRGHYTDQEIRTLRGMIVALSRGKHRKAFTEDNAS